MHVLAEITAVHFLFGGAGLLSFLAFSALIVAPTMGAFTRGWEKLTAALLSFFVLAVLLTLGFGVGVLIVYYWSEISSLFG